MRNRISITWEQRQDPPKKCTKHKKNNSKSLKNKWVIQTQLKTCIMDHMLQYRPCPLVWSMCTSMNYVYHYGPFAPVWIMCTSMDHVHKYRPRASVWTMYNSMDHVHQYGLYIIWILGKMKMWKSHIVKKSFLVVEILIP